jgi:hypothetical protein
MAYLVSGSMNVLFDAGYIATDAIVAHTPRALWGPVDFGLPAARESSLDYVIALYVEWAPSSFHKEASLPASVDYRLVRILDGKVLAEGSVGGSPDSEAASSHEARTASLAGASAAESCVRKLSTLAMGGE